LFELHKREHELYYRRAANPGVPEIENELRRFAYKVSGAEYAITQAVFDLRLLEDFWNG